MLTYWFKLVRMTKPTGDAECPPHIERAHEINDLTNEKAGTRDLDDDEFADEVIVIGSDDDEPVATTPRVSVKTETQGPTLAARHSITPASRPSRTSRTPGLDLLTSITASLDPRLHAARDDDRAARTLQTTQIISMSNQLRDANMTINGLRDQLLQVERERTNAERRADRLEMQLEMARLMQHDPDRRQGTRYVRRETRYTDGGASMIWVSPDDEEDNHNFNHHEDLRDVVSQQDYVEDPKTGRYTLRRPTESPLPRRQLNHFQPVTPRQSSSLSAQFNVSFTPTSSRTSTNDFSIVISPSRATAHVSPSHPKQLFNDTDGLQHGLSCREAA
jgi:hypothetical protein